MKPSGETLVWRLLSGRMSICLIIRNFAELLRGQTSGQNPHKPARKTGTLVSSWVAQTHYCRLRAVVLKYIFMTLRSLHFGGIVAVLGVTLLLSTSATTDAKGQHMAVGSYLPKVMITSERTTRDVLAKGKLTLVHFWASYDAESRAKHAEYVKYLASLGADSLDYCSISLDVDAEVYRQTLAFDGVGEGEMSLCVESNRRNELIALCGIQGGLHAYLVDEMARIVAVDPSTSELETIVRN